MVEPTAIPGLARDTFQAVRDIVVGMMTIWEERGKRWAVTEVSDLFFWGGGMRQTLQKIADGHGTEADLQQLRRQLDVTEAGVSAVTDALNKGWDKIVNLPGGLAIAHEIGEIIHSPLGKMGIRHGIDLVTQGRASEQMTINGARRLCSDIDNFNKRLIDLHERVLKPAAEIMKAGGQ